MLKKEIQDTLKQTVVILSFLLLMPIVHRINEMRLPGGTSSLEEYMINGGTLVFAMLVIGLAYMMFSSEEKDGALEYLKTLPISKWELLKVKLLPRFIALSLLTLVLCAFYRPDNPENITDIFFLILSPIIFTSIVALIYGFSLGISDRQNPVLIGAVVLLSSYPIFFGFVVSNKIYRYIVNQSYAVESISLYALVHFFSVILPALIPLCLLIPVFRSWDCASGKIRSQSILKRLAVPTILIVVLWVVLLP